MTNCIGKKYVNVTYTHTEPDKIGIEGVGQVYCPLNGGSLSTEWTENLQFRRYFDVGHYTQGDTRSCGVIYGFICGYYPYSSLNQEYIFEDNRWYLLDGENKIYLRQNDKNDADFLAAIENQENNEEYYNYVDRHIFSNNAGILGSSLRLYKVANCTRDYPSSGATAALNYTKLATCRAISPKSRWYLSIKENGQEIHQYGSPETGFEGIGLPAWNPPNRQIIYEPSTTEEINFSFEKTRLDTDIRVSEIEIETRVTLPRYSSSDQRYYIGAPRRRVIFEEIDNFGNVVADYNGSILSGGVPIPEDIKITCEYCPDNTCPVDCGDKICCYGSDGIATEYFTK